MANNWRFHHFGVMVRDIEKAADYYSSFGMESSELPGGLETVEKTVYSKPGDWKNRTRLANVGPVQMEIVQPVTGKTVKNLQRH